MFGDRAVRLVEAPGGRSRWLKWMIRRASPSQADMPETRGFDCTRGILSGSRCPKPRPSPKDDGILRVTIGSGAEEGGNLARRDCLGCCLDEHMAFSYLASVAVERNHWLRY